MNSLLYGLPAEASCTVTMLGLEAFSTATMREPSSAGYVWLTVIGSSRLLVAGLT